jgi:hypothetical protein
LIWIFIKSQIWLEIIVPATKLAISMSVQIQNIVFWILERVMSLRELGQCSPKKLSRLKAANITNSIACLEKLSCV